MPFNYRGDAPWAKDLEKLARKFEDDNAKADGSGTDGKSGGKKGGESKCYLMLAGADGEAIAGEALGSEVHNEAAKDLIRIEKWDWALGVSAEHVQSESYSRGSVMPEVFKFTLSMDQSTPALFAHLSSGLKLQALKFKEFRSTSTASGGQFQLSLLIELTDVFVIKAAVSNGGSAVPSVDVELMFDSIAFEYYPFSAEGVRQSGSGKRYQWKPQTSKVLLNGQPFGGS